MPLVVESKSLVKNNINLDIIAGISIGGINAATIAGTNDEEHAEQLLENFWMDLSEGFIDLDKFSFFSYCPRFIARSFLPDYDFMKSISTEAAKGAEINNRYAGYDYALSLSILIFARSIYHKTKIKDKNQ